MSAGPRAFLGDRTLSPGVGSRAHAPPHCPGQGSGPGSVGTVLCSQSAEHHASRVTSTGEKRIHTGCVTEVQGANYILWKLSCSIVFNFSV